MSPLPTAPPTGRRDRLVRIEALSDTVATSGFPTQAPTTLADVWMAREDLEPPFEPERFDASQLSARTVSRWWLAYRSDMDPELVDVPKRRRLLYRGRVYDIVWARVLGAKRDIQLQTLSGGQG